MLLRFWIILVLLCSFQLNHAEEPITPIDPDLLPRLLPAKVLLGASLFSDPLLSKTKTMACDSCHPKDQATTDGLVFSLDIYGKPLTYNTPALTYVTLNQYFTWTGRFSSLRQHLQTLLHKENLMNISWAELITRLAEDVNYPEMFMDAGFERIDAQSIGSAIIAYEKSLIRPSKFDLYLLGDTNQLNQNEIKGYQAFKDYGCIACHQGINVGGNLRQTFGVMKAYFFDDIQNQLRDLGYFNTTKQIRDKYSFRVPGLRDVSRTAPYFHDGSAKTLHEAVMVMFEYQLGVIPKANDVNDIVAFLRSLDALE